MQTEMPTLTPPSDGAPVEQKKDFVHYQLDLIGTETSLLGGLHQLGDGCHERLQGGAPCSHPSSTPMHALPCILFDTRTSSPTHQADATIDHAANHQLLWSM